MRLIDRAPHVRCVVDVGSATQQMRVVPFIALNRYNVLDFSADFCGEGVERSDACVTWSNVKIVYAWRTDVYYTPTTKKPPLK